MPSEDLFKLPEDLEKIARDELNEDPSRREADLQALKEWIAKQPHLRARTDDGHLLTFLRGSKYSLERAKYKIDMFYSMRHAAPEVTTNRDPLKEEVKAALECGTFLPLHGTDVNGRRIIIMRAGAADPNKLDNDLSLKANMMIVDVMMLEDPRFVICGFRALMDMAGLSMAHAAHMGPTQVKKMTMITQEAYPIRAKKMDFINVNKIFYTINQIFQLFMKEKMKRRLQVHTDAYDDIYKEIPKDILPVEYGGSAGTIKDLTDYWTNKVISYRDWFLNDEQYGCDESKRPGKPKNYNDIFGVEGSFRKLNVD